MALVRSYIVPKDRKPESVKQLVLLQSSEIQGTAKLTRDSTSLVRVGIPCVQGKEEACIGVNYHLCSSLSRRTVLGMIFFPKTARARAAKSGNSTFAGTRARGGHIRATGRVRFNIVTSSPRATHAKTAPKSLRTFRILAVLVVMFHIMLHIEHIGQDEYWAWSRLI